MSDLTRWLHEFADACEIVAAGRWPGPLTAARLREVAAALEAAREDAARLDWLAGDAVLTSGWREHGTWETPALLVNSTRETCTPRDFRAAIDQARGKGGCGEGVAP